MIGDSKNDILAAKAANMESIGLTYGYNYGEDIRVYQPDWCLNNFSELLDLLREHKIS
jgi:phosphoglycolate phosphatase